MVMCFMVSCGASKRKASKNRKVTVEATKEKTLPTDAIYGDSTLESIETPLANNIVSTALSYSGTRYKFGGTTRKGMDCSGLLYVAFKEHDIALQRTSYNMATQGEKIPLKVVQKGDLLFFKTTKKRKRINHVGLVVETDNDAIKFIHSTTSRGVIISSLNEGYWNYAFVEARRILQ